MRLTDLHIDGFGVLAGIGLEELTPGLNVIHGPNGSGKTTLLHFLRGVWCGFDDARRRRFLPPLSGGHPGGTVGMAAGERSYRLTRQSLPNQTDRFAVAVRRADIDDASAVRGIFEAVAPELVHLLYAVSAAEGHALERLLRLAAHDGIRLIGRRRPSTRFDARLAEVRERRAILLGGDGDSSETRRLRDACTAAADELESLRRDADRLRQQLTKRYSQLDEELTRLQQRVEWLDLERQAVATDITEAENRPVITVRPGREVVVVESQPQDELRPRMDDLDRRIGHARTVLEDLAQHRMSVSVKQAQVVGLEPLDVRQTLLQQRHSLHVLEHQVLQLRDAAQELSAAPACQCAQYQTLVQQTVQTLQQHLYLLCQQLARQEQAHQQWLLHTERSHLDQCEVELLAHLARLHRERERLLAAAGGPEWSALRHPTPLEVGACGCRDHQAFAAGAGSTVRVEVVAAPETVRTSDPRLAGWRERYEALDQEWQESRRAWRAALELRGEWDLERSRLVVLERRIAEQQVEVELRQRQLAARIEEGQALLVVEAGLAQMRDTIFEDEPAQVMAEASAYFSELTHGRYRALEVTPEQLELFACNDSGVTIPASALSRGALDQAGLSLRIALADEYSRRGLNLPLVFDDVLSDSDPDRLDIAIRLLQRVAQRRQILFLTCQEHVAARFEAAGIPVRDFPGTQRVPTRLMATRPAEAAPAALATVDSAEQFTPEERHARLATEGIDLRFLAGAAPTPVHPSEPHWLRVTSPVSVIPSVGEQMARRLASAGIRNIGDLVERDPEDADLPLTSLQISPSQWRIWQAEGRLLCCVPRLTGRDAQLLVACGILVPQELAETDADSLVRRIDRLRGDGRSGWTLPGLVWPDRPTVQQWIRCGREARTWREARESSGWVSSREPRGRGEGSEVHRPATVLGSSTAGRHVRVDQPSPFRGPRQRRRLSQRLRMGRGGTSQAGAARDAYVAPPANRAEPTPIAPGPAVRDVEAATSGSARLRFFLSPQSSVVDAPSIGPTTARRLERIGILTVADLLSRDPQQVTDRLQHRRVTADMVRDWQNQARLMCQIPELRGHDAQVLVACGLTDPEAIGRMSPQALYAIVGPFVATKEGQRLLRSAKSPDLAEVANWITWAQQARALKAA